MWIIFSLFKYIYCNVGSTSSSTGNARIMNKFVSTSRKPLKSMNLQWVPYNGKGIRSARSKAWEFMGQLIVCTNDNSGQQTSLDDSLVYCKYCFNEQLNEAEGGSLSKIYRTSSVTASGNWLSHAAAKHSKTFQKDVPAKLTAWFHKVQHVAGANSAYEFNQDLAMMMCRDLQPFSITERDGFKEFCQKNIGFELPSADTLATTALVDLFTLTKRRVVELLSQCVSGTLMMDGWTDRHHAHPYFAIRISVVHDWSFKICTLAIKPVASHMSSSLSRFVKDTVEEYLPVDQKFLLFNTTDGAANMLLLSKLLGHDRITCVAHGIHLLVTVDSMSKEVEVENLLTRCKQIVKTLHFKGHMVSVEQMNAQDAELFEQIRRMQDALTADEENPVMDSGNSAEASVVAAEEASTAEIDNDRAVHKHTTLKTSMPTRWNSTLTMVESILDLRQPVREVLKKLGKSDMILDKDDFDLLEQLRQFLTTFSAITNLISENSPNLSLIPLIRTSITKSCQTSNADLPAIKRVKKKVLEGMDQRVPMNKLVKISAALDPSVRDIVMSKTESSDLLEETYKNLYKSPNGERIFSSLNDDVDNQFQAVQSTTSQKSDHPCAPPMAKKTKLALIQEAIDVSQQTVIESPVQAEISKYMGMSDMEDALNFWERNTGDLPLLSAMARVYLALSPGSVPVEQLFSTAGLILNGKRSQLSPFRMNMICCVHDNYKLI